MDEAVSFDFGVPFEDVNRDPAKRVLDIFFIELDY